MRPAELMHRPRVEGSLGFLSLGIRMNPNHWAGSPQRLNWMDVPVPLDLCTSTLAGASNRCKTVELAPQVLALLAQTIQPQPQAALVSAVVLLVYTLFRFQPKGGGGHV